MKYETVEDILNHKNHLNPVYISVELLEGSELMQFYDNLKELCISYEQLGKLDMGGLEPNQKSFKRFLRIGDRVWNGEYKRFIESSHYHRPDRLHQAITATGDIVRML